MQAEHIWGSVPPDAVHSQAEQDEAQLVKASQQGDQDAFALLVQRHQRCIFTMILRMVQDYSEANEVTQEAFLAAWQGLPSFRGEVSFVIWLYRIAYNCGLRQLEWRKQEQALPIGTIKTHLYRISRLLKERLYNAFSNAP